MKIVTAQPEDPLEVEGVNNRAQLARLERAHQARIAEALMAEGVALLSAIQDVYLSKDITIA